MRLALTSAHYPNDKTESFGLLNETEALGKFDTFPWGDLVREAHELELNEVTCVDADLTFLIDNCHFMARVRDDAMSFSIEVCLKQPNKLFGIFDRPKFYTIDNLPTSEAHEALQVFLAKSDEELHAYFRNLTDQR